MKQEFNVLIVDDHPLIVDAYKSALSYISSNNELKFNIDLANDCDSAYKKTTESSATKSLDIVFLDIKLPPCKENDILSGEDIGILIRELLPKTKIIISTTFNDNYRVHSIFKSVNPEGFLIKNDITPKELVNAIETVILNESPYYSKTVTELLRKQLTQDFILDNVDRQLLYELSIGTKMKDLPLILPLSTAGIEKRRRQLKEVFNIKGKSDRELVLVAIEKGFV